MAIRGQCRRQLPRRLARPAQRRLRVAAGLRVNQRDRCRRQPWVVVHDALTAATRAARPPSGEFRRQFHFRDRLRHRRPRDPHRGGDGSHPAPAQLAGLDPQHQPTLMFMGVRPQSRDPTLHTFDHPRIDHHPARYRSMPSMTGLGVLISLAMTERLCAPKTPASHFRPSGRVRVTPGIKWVRFDREVKAATAFSTGMAPWSLARSGKLESRSYTASRLHRCHT